VRTRDLARRLAARIQSLPTPAVDAGLAIIFIGAVVTERLRNPLPQGLLSVVAGVLTLALAVSLTLRRRVPFTAFAIATAALCAESLLHVQSVFSPLANQVCVYSVGAYASRARARWAVPVIVAGVLLYFAGTLGLDQLDANVAEVLLVWLATWAVGYTVARRRDEQDRARLATARQVVAEERVRISRELHDLVGHTVNLLVVQAGAARLMLDKDPAMTRELLSGMERTGRETLADLDRRVIRWGWHSCRSSWTDSPTPGSTSGCRSSRHCSCPATWTCRSTGSSKKGLRTRSSTLLRARRPSTSGGKAHRWWSRCLTPGLALVSRSGRVEGCWVSRSECRCAAAYSSRVEVKEAGSACGPRFPCDDDPGSAR
jgi:hypothetical protein